MKICVHPTKESVNHLRHRQLSVSFYVSHVGHRHHVVSQYVHHLGHRHHCHSMSAMQSKASLYVIVCRPSMTQKSCVIVCKPYSAQKLCHSMSAIQSIFIVMPLYVSHLGLKIICHSMSAIQGTGIVCHSMSAIQGADITVCHSMSAIQAQTSCPTQYLNFLSLSKNLIKSRTHKSGLSTDS